MREKSRVAGYHYLTNKQTSVMHSHVPLNGAILIECALLKNVVTSSAEAETAGIFHNCKAAIPLRHMLQVLGNLQPPTPEKPDNSTACAISRKTISAKGSKTWDMRYHWIQDRVCTGDFVVYWRPGVTNLSDYFTKHFHPTYHQHIHRRIFCTAPTLPERGFLFYPQLDVTCVSRQD